jgi:hypothetical protein
MERYVLLRMRDLFVMVPMQNADLASFNYTGHHEGDKPEAMSGTVSVRMSGGFLQLYRSS